jgi:restriction system protein
MSIPDYQTLMLPLLQFTADQEEHTLSEAVDKLATQFNLTDEERAMPLPSGPADYSQPHWLGEDLHEESGTP